MINKRARTLQAHDENKAELSPMGRYPRISCQDTHFFDIDKGDCNESYSALNYWLAWFHSSERQSLYTTQTVLKVKILVIHVYNSIGQLYISVEHPTKSGSIAIENTANFSNNKYLISEV